MGNLPTLVGEINLTTVIFLSKLLSFTLNQEADNENMPEYRP
jgi:hypothetical protein